MKEKIQSYLRHAVTALPSVGGFLVTKGWLQTPEGAQLDVLVQDFLLGLSAIVAAVLARFVMWALAKYAPGLSSILGGSSGGNATGWVILGATVAAGGLLPSCTPLSAALTNTPIPAVSVQRAGHDDATPFQVAAADVAQAEAEAEIAAKSKTEPVVHGLYDAGRAAKAVREVFTNSGK